MLSMTGYGRAFCESDGRQMTMELKSVNHRFLDIAFRVPRNLLFVEEAARKAISARLNRGHVDVFVTYRNLRVDARTVTVDRALFAAINRALGSVAESGLKDDRSMMSIARLPEVLVVTEAEEDREAVTALTLRVLGEALDQLVAMRAREGEAMRRDLQDKVDAIERMTGEIELRYPETVDAYRQRLRAAVAELIAADIDETRLLTEVALMADRSAIEEEIVRLRSHIEQLRRLFDDTQPIGRRIDFIVQELNREANTISSKSQDIPITRLTVDIKAEIEKLREQLQNVE